MKAPPHPCRRKKAGLRDVIGKMLHPRSVNSNLKRKMRKNMPDHATGLPRCRAGSLRQSPGL